MPRMRCKVCDSIVSGLACPNCANNKLFESISVADPFFYLRVPGSSDRMSIRPTSGGTIVDREAVKLLFSRACDGEGNAFYRYIPRSSPALIFERTTAGVWRVHAPSKSFHLLREGSKPINLGTSVIELEWEDRLVVFSRRKGLIEPCAFVISR